MKSIKIILLLMLTAGLSMAQVSWLGYFESQADGAFLDNDSILFGYNKLRLDLEANPGDNVRIGSNVIIQQMWGQTTFNLVNYLPEHLVPLVRVAAGDLLLQPLKSFPYTLQDTFYVDNLYFQLYGEKFRLTLGKQQISPGTGYVWNPTDIFNVKDIMDPAYEQTGVKAIGLDIYPMAGNSVFLAVQPNKDLEHTTMYFRGRQSMGALDMSLSIARYVWPESGFVPVVFIPWERTFKRFMSGVDFSADIAGVGLHGEYAINKLSHLGFYYNPRLDILFTHELVSGYQSGKNYNEYLIGLDYTFNNSLFVMAEYFHSDFGRKKENQTFNDFVQVLSGSTRSLGKDYIFLQAMYPLTSLITAGVFTISNIEDKST
ncbi:MAG TPA: hypothetical protein ENO01_00685, partial [Candidatus Marinimicrobia bacterium]|nr:hypothetical protein [Candidatus Neomarinimicrobiota bacterium]